MGGGQLNGPLGGWHSDNQNVTDLANDLDELYPGIVQAVDLDYINPLTNRPITDVDIVTTVALIQVKTGNMSGWEEQARKTLIHPIVNPNKLPVIVFRSDKNTNKLLRHRAEQIGVLIFGKSDRQTLLDILKP